GRGNADDGIVLLTELHDRLAENVLPVGRCAGLGRGSRTGLDVVGAGAVEFFRVLNGDIVASAFLGKDVQHDGRVGDFRVFQDANQQRQVVAVNRPDITQAHFLENHAAAVSAAAVGPQMTVGG